MEMNSYQDAARKTAAYPDVGRNPIYPTLGLTGEAGEVADKVYQRYLDSFENRVPDSFDRESFVSSGGSGS